MNEAALNEKSKNYMKNQKLSIVNALESTFSEISLFEDEIAEDEEKHYKNAKYSAFILSMGDFQATENEQYLLQDFTIDYYSEQRDDLDEMILDIISTVSNKNIQFQSTTKLRAKVKDTNRFIDVVSINFVRKIKHGC